MSGADTKRAAKSGATLRTFIAIDLPASILDALAATQKQLQAVLAAQNKAAEMRWSPVKNLHLTLRFLGDTTPAQSEQVTQRLQALAATTAPLTLQVDLTSNGLGGFPTLRQPRVLWVGLGGELATLKQLQAQVEVLAQSTGFAPEEKSFSPHLTLARAAREADRRSQQQVGQLISDYAQGALSATTLSFPTSGMSFDVDHLTYYQSDLGAGGSRYTVLAKAPLAAG
jgi:2'-5' RNA ligase